MTVQQRMPKYSVVGGKKMKWWYQDDETQVKALRIFLLEETRTGQRHWAADYKLCGVEFPEYRKVALGDIEASEQGRPQAFSAAKRQLQELPLPVPAERVVA